MIAGHNRPTKETTQAPQSPPLQLTYKKRTKIFISRNWFGALLQTEPIEVDTITSNSTFEINNPKVHSQQDKITHLLPPIMVKEVKNYELIRRTHRPSGS